MNVGKALRDHYLRIDARSLGLFRLAMGLVLIGDLLRRWKYVKEFYSNDGVLPNHNHLFNLRETGQVWSLLHAISSPGEAHVAFAVILLVYVLFTLGYHTRVFHVIAVVCLVSLTGRNILLENPGNYVAIALLGLTAFLPLGSRFSLDSLLFWMRARDEKRAGELNDRALPTQDQADAARIPGWTPTSLAALAVMLMVGVILICEALQQSGAAWKDGTALYQALNVERWVSGPGAWARSALPIGVLSLWSRALRGAEWAIPALVILPFAWRVTRNVAVGLLLFYGLTLGVFFSVGLFGWTFVAAALLFVPEETWTRFEGGRQKKKLVTMVYDADCGVCLALARLIKRLDLRQNLAFQGNDDLEELILRRDGGALERVVMPKEVTFELVQETVLAIDAEGHVFTKARAVARMIRALPLGAPIAFVMTLPGIVNLLDALYGVVAARRQSISVLMGKEACGIDSGPHEPEVASVASYRTEPTAAPAGPTTWLDLEEAPVTRARRIFVGLFREGAVALLFWAALAQTSVSNDVPYKVKAPEWLTPATAWTRMMARWDLLAKLPETDDVVTIDAQTKGGKSVDPLTGNEPQFDPGKMRGTGLGQLWGDYLERIHQKEWNDYQRAFRDFIQRGGPGWDNRTGDEQITGLDCYLLKQTIPPPGQPRPNGLVARDKVFTQSRGGRLGSERLLPLLRPDMLKR